MRRNTKKPQATAAPGASVNQPPSHFSRLMRGGRLTKWKGQVASYAPHLAQLVPAMADKLITRLLPAALLLGLAAASPAVGDTLYWDPNGTDFPTRGGSGTWNTTNLFWSLSGDGTCSTPCQAWVNDATPDDAVFGGIVTGTVTLGVPITVNDLLFESGVTTYTITGSTLTLAANGADTPTITVGSGVVNIASIIAGSSGFEKLGGGTVNLTGDNSATLTGNITVTEGRLHVNGTNALGAAGGVLNMASGTLLNASGSLSGREVNLTGTGEVSLQGTGVGSAFFTGTGGINVGQSITLSNDTNDYEGQTIFTGDARHSFTSIANEGMASALGAAIGANATIIIDAPGNTFASNRAVYVGTTAASSNRDWSLLPAGATETFIENSSTNNSTLTLSGDIIAGGAGLTGIGFDARTGDLNLQGVISSESDRNVQFTGGGVGRKITLGGLNTFTGAVFIGNLGHLGTVTVEAVTLANAGTNSSLGAGNAANAADSAITINNGSALSYIGDGDVTNRAWVIDGNGSIRNDGTGALDLTGTMTFQANNPIENFTLGGSFAGESEISGAISGTGSVIMAGGADNIWLLSGANTYSGTTTVNSGTLRAGSAQAFGTSRSFIVNGGTLDLAGFDKTVNAFSGTGGTVELGTANLTVNSSTNATFAGSISGDGSFTKAGTGTLTLSGQSDYTGATTIGGGTLALNFGGANAPDNDIIDADSALVMAGGILAATGASGETNSQTFNGLEITAGNNRITAEGTAGGTMTVNLGGITRTGGLIDFGIGAGGTITTDTLVNPAGFLGGWATVTTGTTTDYAEVDASGNIVAFTDYDDKDEAATWADGDVVSDNDGDAATFSGTVTATATTDPDGDGKVELGGLQYTVNASSTVNIAAGTTLSVDGNIIVSSSVSSSNKAINNGQITGGANGGTLGILHNGTGNFTIGSTIVNNGGDTDFTKGGTGTVILAGNNTYTGVTTLSSGILSVSNIGNGGEASNIGASTADASNLVLENGTLRYTGVTDTTNRGLTLVNGGPARNIEVGAGVNLTFEGLVTSTDDAGLSKTGSGTLTLSNSNNDYKGGTRIVGGVLSVNTLANGGVASGIGMSSANSANLEIAAGATLQYTGATVSSDRGFTLGFASGRIDVSNAGTELTLSGAAVGVGRLFKDGAGTLVLAGLNTYTGGTTVSAGTLRAGSTQAFGGAVDGTGAGQMNVLAGATLDLANNNNIVGGLVGGGTVTLGSAILTINNDSGTPGFTGNITGTGGITITAGNQVMTTCNNSYTGVTTIEAGLTTNCLANAGQNSGIGASSDISGGLVLNTGALTYTGTSVSIDRGFTLQQSGNAIVVSESTTILGFGGAVVGSGALVKQGPGTLVLSGNNTYAGGTRVSGGTLRAGSASAFGTGGMTLDNTAAVTLDVNNQIVSVASLSGGGTTGGNVTLGTGTLTISQGSNAVYAGAISGSGGLVKNGSTVQTLSGCSSSYTGSTTVNGGTLSVACLANGGSNSAIGAASADAANLVINGGTLHYTGTGHSTDRLFTLGGSATTKLDASGAGAVHFTNAGAIAFSTPDAAQTIRLGGTSTADNSLAALIGNNGAGITSLTKLDAGTWILNNQASTYTGITTISGGVLGVDKLANGGSASSIGASTKEAKNLVIGSGATLRYTGTGDTTDRLFTLSVGTSSIESSGTGAIEFTNTDAAAYDGTGARTLALGGTNTDLNIMGGTIIDAPAGGVTTLVKNGPGTWALTGNNSFTGNTTINDGNLMIGNGGTTGNAGTGNVIVNSATSTLSFNRSDIFNFTGTLSGPGTIAQIGAGTTVLTSATNAIGATRVDAGTLQVDGGLTTATIAMNGTGILTVNGTVGASGGNPSTMTGDGGASTINVNALAILRANGDLGGGSDVVNLTGTLATGGAVLNLGDGNDTLALNDGGSLTGAGVNAGTGTGDILQVNNALARTIDGLNVGGFESLNKTLGGLLTLTGDHSYSAGTTVDAGELRIGDGGTSGSLASNVLLNNASILSFDRSDESTFAGLISGTGGVNQIGTGITILEGDNTYGGPTNVNSGTLIINGTQSGTGPTTVATGATLGGSGTIGGNVTVADGGAINPGGVGNSAGTLNINGNLALNDTSTLNFNFGQANTPGGSLNDLIEVEGDLTLDGILNVSTTIGGSFGPGVYRVINYTGDLDDQGLELGTMPAGSNAIVQTSVANQVNLVNQGDLLLTFWDGPGNQNDGEIQGGDGVWQNSTGNDNWTDAAGTVNAPWADAQFAIFQGSSGTVTIDNGVGGLNPVISSGMQFAVDGYIIAGDPLTLVNDPSSSTAVIRVGAGPSAGSAAMTATITAVLQGGATVAKTDLGTLILTGNNTYTGGTLIEDGVLQVSSDANLGAAAGALTINGGTLRNTGVAFASARTVTLGAQGGTFETVANLDLTGVIGGSGALTKTGASTLTLTNTANSYSGGTIINQGTVSVAFNENLGAITGAVTFNGGTLQNTAGFTSARTATITAAGGTFETLADLTWTGVIGGATGALTKTGAETLILTAANTYGGGTTISEGTLQLGDGGATGSITGNVTVATDATLAFNRDNTSTLIFGGLISGGGGIEQIGTGTTILTANNTYDGPTRVAEGTLIVDGDQTQANGPTTVEDGGTLGGIGTIGGHVFIEDGGTLSPGSPAEAGDDPGTLNIIGDLNLADGALLAYTFGEADVEGGPLNDLTRVTGNLILDGTINVTTNPSGVFGPGIYRIISYTGDLDDRELLTDAATAEAGFTVQTSIDGQVNLVLDPEDELELTFWDVGPKDNGFVDGGQNTTEIWEVGGTRDNWTDQSGAQNAAWDNGNFAIFAATPGIVTIDNGADAETQVQAAGMQFATNGYLINGETLTLVDDPTRDGDPASRIVVGDGSTEGAGYIATIQANIAGEVELVKQDRGTLVLGGTNTYAGGTRIEGGTVQVSANANLGAVDGDLTFASGTLHTTASFATGRNVNLESTGTIFTDPATTLTLNGPISGVGGWTKDGAGTVLQNGVAINGGPTTVAAGTLIAGGENVFSVNSVYRIEEDGTLDLAGNNQTIGALGNAGAVRLNGAPGTTLTTLGDYVGAGGTLFFNTVLGDDNSVTDQLVVNEDTSGTSNVSVTNIGGTGAATVVGIKVIDVEGDSDGVFNLLGDYEFDGQQAVVAGAYSYVLVKDDAAGPGDDGDWYLRSIIDGSPILSPAVPIYEAFASILQDFDELETLQRRVGSRSWLSGEGNDGGDGSVETQGFSSGEKADLDRTGIWARIKAGHAHIEPGEATTVEDYEVTTWKIQAGIDVRLSESESGALIGGIAAHFGTAHADINAFSDGEIDVTGYGLSGTLTWYSVGGFYVDTQAQASLYDSDLSSDDLGELEEGNDGWGYALSIEAGQKLPVSDHWSLTPQAQLTYAEVDFDDFTDPFGAEVSLEDNDTLVGRLGVSADYENAWQNEMGEVNRSHVYGITSVYYDFLDGTEVDVSGTSVFLEKEELWGSAGLGGSLNWADDTYSLYGEALAKTSLEAFGDSYSLNGTLGFRVRW